MAIKRRDNPNGFDSGTINVRDSVYDEALGIYNGFGAYDKWNSYNTGTGIVDNPYALTAQDLSYYSLYMAGSNPVNATNKSLLEAAYNKVMAAQQWYSSQQSMVEDREYDSPVNEVSRQQEAGLNPDLTGIGVDPSTASTPPETTPLSAVPSANAGDMMQQVFGLVGSIASFGLSFLQTGSSIMKTIQSIRNARGEYSSNLLSKSLPALISYLPDEAFNRGAKLSDYFTEEFVTGSGYTARDFREMSGFLESAKLPQGSRTEFEESLTRATMSYQARTAAVMDPLRPDFLNETYIDFIQMDADRRFLESSAAAALARYNLEYRNQVDPELAADAFDSSNQQILNDEALQENEMKRTFAQSLPEIYMLVRAYQYLQSGNELQQVMGISLYNTVTGKNGSIPGAVYSSLSALSETPVSGLATNMVEGTDGLIRVVSHLLFGSGPGAPVAADKIVSGFQDFSDYVLNPAGNSKGKGIAKFLWDSFKASSATPPEDFPGVPNMLDSYNHFYGK